MKLIMGVFISTFLLVCCGQNQSPVFISDRHGDSYTYLKENLSHRNPITVIQLDYHHDMGPGPGKETPTSYNWLGGLVEQDYVKEIYWVSGRNLQKPNFNARKAWLLRKISPDPLGISQTKENKVHIVDWPQLMEIKSSIKKPIVITLDLDILTIDPGDDPDKFLSEMLDFIEEMDPEYTTLSLSAAYQRNPQKGWYWFNQSLHHFRQQKHPIILDGGDEQRTAESQEELTSWYQWNQRSLNTDYGYYFAPGLELWNEAPQSTWEEFAHLDITSYDPSLNQTIKLLYRELSLKPSDTKLHKWIRKSQSYIKEIYTEQKDGYYQKPPPPAFDKTNGQGLAVRFIKGREDRGCISYYQGITDIEGALRSATYEAALTDPRYAPITKSELPDIDIEISLFSNFNKMDNPMDFIPGVDTLLMDFQGNRTLLQASLAVERDLSRRQFLQTLSRKATGDPHTWKHEGVIFSKASTVYGRRPVDDSRR